MKKLYMLLIFVLLGIVVLFVYQKGEDTYKKINKSAEKRLAITSITPTIPEEELINVQDLSSESKGRWVGLCKKDSIFSVEDFYNQVMVDPTLVKHFSDFLWSRAILTELNDVTYAQVAHRSGSVIAPTRRVLNLPKGDKVITDGNRIVRAHCCNDVYLVEQPPIKTLVKEPPVQIITPPIYVPETPEEIPPVYSTIYPNVHHIPSGRYIEHIPPSSPSPAPVPEPSTMLLFGAGLTSLAFIGRRKKKK